MLKARKRWKKISDLRKIAPLAFGLAMAHFAHAGMQARPYVGGYSGYNDVVLSVVIYSSAEEYAKYACAHTYTNGKPKQFNGQIQYISSPGPSQAYPQFYYVCTAQPPYVDNTLYLSTVGGYWCLYSQNQTSSTTPPNCSVEFDKPPLMACGKPANSFGDPIDMSAKEATLQEQDYASAQGLEFTRYYSSIKMLQGSGGMRQGWRHNYSKVLTSKLVGRAYSLPFYYSWTARGWGPADSALQPVVSGVTQSIAYLTRPDGHSYYFTSSDGGASWKSDGDVNYTLTVTQTDGSGNVLQWQLITPDYDTETYDQNGRLVAIQFRSGKSQMLTYSDASTPAEIAPQAGLMLEVRDNFGAALHFQYDSKSRLVQMTDAAGQLFAYTYDANNNLVRVTYPNGLQRQYLYAEPAYDQVSGQTAFNHLLTGVSDEISAGNIVRYTTLTYDASGNPISTQLPNGVNKYTFNYGSNVVTDPLGTKRTYNYTKINGLALSSSVSAPAGAGCSAATSSTYYETDNGNPTTRVDFNGNSTNYTYDLTRNLETRRVEAANTSQPRTISTQWHSQYRLPVKVAAPLKLTTYTYDSAGNVLTKTEQATSDATGAALLNPALTGSPRTWSYTYNNAGQLLTAADPLNNTTSYVYDSQGNLTSVTNAAGQITTLANYDANGRVGRITDPNGVVTDLNYTVRGWLSSKTVTAQGIAETTSYDYDGVGNMTQATLPDGTAVHYTYDEARRLTDIADSRGNTVHYTLDAIGNRTGEQVRDPNGTLVRQITRVYDALNRLQTITGGVQ